MYFQAPVKTKGKRKYHFEVNIDESYSEGIVDEWGAAYVWDGKGEGAEYNICFDGTNEMSAIYKADVYETDPTTYEHYEIDFSDDEWKQKLINRMIECTERWWN